ncbi:hypothetical protein EVAR_23810_1 [Eumeta japonica]|uniref:Uncharacterized protein n=1 Tax=Eumeta variegata TaxID=151549 RepID=A0A4C1VMT0_EUMVA|nr:hypothetical protein EVAR_23810_1 [Eumeta japonica]
MDLKPSTMGQCMSRTDGLGYSSRCSRVPWLGGELKKNAKQEPSIAKDYFPVTSSEPPPRGARSATQSCVAEY